MDLLGRAYGVQSIQSVYNYFHTPMGWIDETLEFPLVRLLQGLKNGDAECIRKLKEMSVDFALDSNGSFSGCIGAIYGLAIRIRCPSNVQDPSGKISML